MISPSGVPESAAGAAAAPAARARNAPAANTPLRTLTVIGNSPRHALPHGRSGTSGRSLGSGGVRRRAMARAPPGALRTAVRRQAGLRAYELPCAAWRARSPSQARGLSGCRFDLSGWPWYGSITVAGAAWELRETRVLTSRLIGWQCNPTPDAAHGASASGLCQEERDCLEGPEPKGPALTVAPIAGRLEQRSGVRRPRGRRVKREAGETLKVNPALPPQR